MNLNKRFFLKTLAAMLLAPSAFSLNAQDKWRLLGDDELLRVGDQLFVDNMNSCCLRKTGPGSYEPYPHKGPGWVWWRGLEPQPTCGEWIKSCNGSVKAFRRATSNP